MSVKTICKTCGKEVELPFVVQTAPGSGNWLGVCPECRHTMKLKLPEARIVMLFANDDTEEFFTNEYQPFHQIISYYAFDDPESFVRTWKRVVKDPDGMWYWVYDNGRLVCSGACDEVDADILEEYFDIPIFNKRFKVTVTCSAETYVYAPDLETAKKNAADKDTLMRALRNMKAAYLDKAVAVVAEPDDGKEGS